eukprot:g8085.t1
MGGACFARSDELRSRPARDGPGCPEERQLPCLLLLQRLRESSRLPVQQPLQALRQLLLGLRANLCRSTTSYASLPPSANSATGANSAASTSSASARTSAGTPRASAGSGACAYGASASEPWTR